MLQFIVFYKSINDSQRNYLLKLSEKSSIHYVHDGDSAERELAELLSMHSSREQTSNNLCFLILKNGNWLPSERILGGIFDDGYCHVSILNENGFIEGRNSQKFTSDFLFIYPGDIFPLNNGSRHRAFNFLYNLRIRGFSVDVLMQQGVNFKDAKHLSYIGVLCNNVYFYALSSERHNRKKRFVRAIERRVRFLLGKSGKLYDKFSERLYIKSPESCKIIAKSLFLRNKYRYCVASYAWMIPAFDYFSDCRALTKIVCDTHDVQYVRNENFLSRRERLFFDSGAEKRKEIELLKSVDYVLAISEADFNELKENISPDRVLLTPPGFDYAFQEVLRKGEFSACNFGFIGSDMIANEKALEYIFRFWWPVILKHSPESNLFIAGSICNNMKFQSQSSSLKNIIPLGVLDDLSRFYDKIDASLCPVVIQGGMNFKSVESVFGGKHLLTNSLGMRCLGVDFPAHIISWEEDWRAFFRLYADTDLEYAYRKHAQFIVSQKFSNQMAFSGFFSAINFS